MKTWIDSIWMAFVICCAASAQMIFLEGQGSGILTTGDLLDGADHTGITTNVVEVPGLEITARSGVTNQNVNVTTGSMGVTIFSSGDDTDALDAGEKLILSFNRDVRINRLDFNQFTANESITISMNGQFDEIHDLELTHRISDYLDTNLVVLAYVEIEFFTTGLSTVGLDGIDITILESTQSLDLSWLNSNGTAYVAAVFNEIPSTNYVLQHKTDLADTNGWDTISTPFITNTTWEIETTNHTGFYRAVAQ